MGDQAIKEAEIQGKEVRVVASSEDREFTYIPHPIDLDRDYAFLHLTSKQHHPRDSMEELPERSPDASGERHVIRYL